MSPTTTHQAPAGTVRVLSVIGFLCAISGGLAVADSHDASGASKQGPALAANVSARSPEPREPRTHGPNLGAIYPRDRTQSPLTEDVVRNLRAIVERREQNDDVFAKIGASATVNRNYMRCFAGADVELAGRDHLQATIDHFAHGDPREGWSDPFRRRSLSATVGWHAGRAIWGDPPPLVQEVRDIHPRFAVVMYGTNDIEQRQPHRYARLMGRLVDMLTRRGVIPVLTTIMPRGDDPSADLQVPLYNAVIRGVAQMRQVPMIDYHRELLMLPGHGLASDHLHPNVRFVDGDPRGCDFTAEGLHHGYNLRNLITIEALHRLRRVVVEGASAPDAPAPPPSGRGTLGDPIPVSLPFAHAADTRRSTNRLFDRYEACEGGQDESGPEYVYHLHLDAPTRVKAMVIDQGGEADLDLHLLGLGLRGPTCRARADEVLEVDLAAGDHYFAVDSYVDMGGTEHAGRYLFVAASVGPVDPEAAPLGSD